MSNNKYCGERLLMSSYVHPSIVEDKDREIETLRRLLDHCNTRVDRLTRVVEKLDSIVDELRNSVDEKSQEE